jgi:prevent-host-death family protein
MQVTATELQNNFGKYLRLSALEPVVITRNGIPQAVLSAAGLASEVPVVRETMPEYGTNPRKRRLTGYREFMELTEHSDNRYELIDGIVYQLASPGFSHQKTLGALHIEFHRYFQDKVSCAAFMAPFDIELIRRFQIPEGSDTEDDINVVQPDLMVLCDYEKDVNEKDRYKGTPTLVVEILSPSTRTNDRSRKLSLYVESGIQECWHVDPKNRTITVYAFDGYRIADETIYTAGKNETACSEYFKGLNVPLCTIF